MTNTPTTITDTTSPQQVDQQWLDAMWEWFKNAQSSHSLKDYVKRSVGIIEGNRYANNAVIMNPETGNVLTYEEAKAIIIANKAAGVYQMRNGCTQSIANLERCDAYDAAADAARAIVRAADAQWETRQWNRYFLVCSSNGHIHSSTNCHTCNKGKNPTQFALVPSLSGKDIDAAVAELGSALCSVCFPDAPVEYKEQQKITMSQAQTLLEKGEEAFKEAVAKAAERKAKKAAKV